jgi:tRNA1(Val) A37 N6-methylase TrmN6
MGAAEALVALAAIGCGTGVVGMVVNAVTGGRRRASEQELAATRARLAQLELDNEQLRRQVEWHARLLDAQDRVAAQLAPSRGDRPNGLKSPP